MEKDYIYLFNHIPKCGGTSMKYVFRKWSRLKKDYYPPWAKGKKLERYISHPLNLEKIKPGSIICGHYVIDGVYLHQRYPQILKNPVYRIFTFVREPLNLRLSLLRFEIENKWLNGNEPIEQFLFDRPNWLCERFPCTDKNMDKVLSQYFHIGIMEDIQESFNCLAEKMNNPCITLPHLNSTKPCLFNITNAMKLEFYKVHEMDYHLYHKCRELRNA